MKKNMGDDDRVLRIVIAALFTVLYLQGFVNGVLGVVMLVLAGLFTVTSIFGRCPLYTLLHVKTSHRN